MQKFCVMGHFLFCSSAQIHSPFSAMFKDSYIAAKMKFGNTKCSYFINNSLAPYIKEENGWTTRNFHALFGRFPTFYGYFRADAETSELSTRIPSSSSLYS